MSFARVAYSADFFVDRDEETSLVAGLVRQIKEEPISQIRTIVFQGERGSGKSWLSLHLVRTILPQIPGVVPLLIGLFPAPDGFSTGENEYFAEISPDKVNAEQAARSIVEWVAGRVKATTAPDSTLRELANSLARDIKEAFTHQVLVLILDSVFEADWDLLEKLETHLLAPLAALPRVFIVMTGRGRLYSWESPYLRVEARNKQLQPFKTATIEQQLQRQHLQADLSIEEILDLGGGYPLINILLAQDSDKKKVMNDAVEILLSVIQPADRRKRVREYFEAVCVLDGFREDDMAYMLGEYLGTDGDRSAWPLSKVREARDECIKTHLIRWESSRFIIDESVRRVLINTLFLNWPDRWQRLQCRAYRLYNQWADEFIKYTDYYRVKANKHADELRQRGYSPSDC